MPTMLETFRSFLSRRSAPHVINAAEDPFFEIIEDVDYGRRIGRVEGRDFGPLDHEEILRASWDLFRTNPPYKRVVKMTTDFVVGDGFSVQVRDETADDVQEVIDEWWGPRGNNMDERLPQISNELQIFGEQALPIMPRLSGIVEVGLIDSLAIEEILTNPFNALERTEIKLKSMTGAPGEKVKVIRQNRMAESLDYTIMPDVLGMPLGAFYFPVNAASNSRRGVPDLADGIDWFNQYDAVLYNAVERSRIVNAFLFDVEIDGTKDDAAEYAKTIRKQGSPKAGSVRVRNKAVKWTLESTQFGMSENTQIAKLVRQMLLTSAGYPEHFLVEGGDTNLATAKEMGHSVFRMLQARQAYLASMVRQMLRFQLWWARRKGIIAPVDEATQEDEFDVTVHPIVKDERKGQFETISTLLVALRDAVEEGWIEPGNAAAIWRAAGRDIAELEIEEPENPDAPIEPLRDRDRAMIEAFTKDYDAKRAQRKLEELDGALEDAA